MRTMYDAVTPGNIPVTATLVAGYADGHYANLPAMKKRFPHATVVSIAISSKTRAQVLDVETGDATPTSALTWCTKTMADKSNHDLTIYSSLSVMPAIKAAFKAVGVTLPQLWVAHYDGVATVPSGYVAKQYRNTPGYDLSTAVPLGGWHGVDPKVTAKPKVSLAHVVVAAKKDPGAAQGHTTYATEVRLVESALVKTNYLSKTYASDGSFGTVTITAYAKWQRSLGYSGKGADGIPGAASLKALASHAGTFTVVA